MSSRSKRVDFQMCCIINYKPPFHFLSLNKFQCTLTREKTWQKAVVRRFAFQESQTEKMHCKVGRNYRKKGENRERWRSIIEMF